jgi:hypothetical protein
MSLLQSGTIKFWFDVPNQTLGRMYFSFSRIKYPSHQNNPNINVMFKICSNKLADIYKTVEEI